MIPLHIRARLAFGALIALLCLLSKLLEYLR